MMLPAGRYRLVPRVEILWKKGGSDVVIVDGSFIVTHARPCRGELEDYGVLLDILVGEEVKVIVIRNGEEKVYG